MPQTRGAYATPGATGREPPKQSPIKYTNPAAHGGVNTLTLRSRERIEGGSIFAVTDLWQAADVGWR
jgi:hypothetical protein